MEEVYSAWFLNDQTPTCSLPWEELNMHLILVVRLKYDQGS